MNDISVFMAIVDLIPVVLFFAASFILQKDLYGRMVKGAYALLAAGSIMVLSGGILKALWKMLYALHVCDYTLLNDSFFPFQGVGFMLVFLSLVGTFVFEKKDDRNIRLSSVGALPVFTSSMPFVILQIIGCGGTQWCMFFASLKMKKKLAAVLFASAFVFMLAMGYLSAAFDNSSTMHWIAQGVNILSQGSFLGGVSILHKAGFGRD